MGRHRTSQHWPQTVAATIESSLFPIKVRTVSESEDYYQFRTMRIHTQLSKKTVAPIACELIQFSSTKSPHHQIKGLFVEVMPSANNVARARSYVIFATSVLQHHFCNVILIHRIILIFRFSQNHRHRPHSCPCRQQLEVLVSSATREQKYLPCPL